MSNLENFQSNIQSFVISSILNPISDWLIQEKKINVSVDELIDLLKISSRPQKVASTNVSTPAVSLTQSTITGALVTGASTTKAKPKSKPPSKEKNAENAEKFGSCKYVFKRGELKGQECGKALKSADSEFCEQCNKKVTKPSASEKPSESKESESDKKVTTKKVETKPVGFTTPIAKKAEKLKVELREAGGQPNTYIDIQTNIVVKKVLDGEKSIYVAVGVQEENGFRTLTEEEKKDAVKRGFALQNPSSGESKPISVKNSRPSGIPDIDSDNE